jgi:hypothetical protein
LAIRQMDPNAPGFTLETLQEQFSSALVKACDVSRVRIFVDALDEIKEDELRELLADIRKLNTVANRNRKSLSICYSGRYYAAIVVDNDLQIRLEQWTEDDARLFLRAKLENVHIPEDS